MDLDRAGIEYTHWGITPPPDATPLLALEGSTPTQMEWWDDTEAPTFARVADELGLALDDIAAGRARIARKLIAGTDATPPQGAVQVALGRTRAAVHVPGVSEYLIRAAGAIDCH